MIQLDKTQQTQIFSHQFMHVSSNKFYHKNESKWNPQPQLMENLKQHTKFP